MLRLFVFLELDNFKPGNNRFLVSNQTPMEKAFERTMARMIGAGLVSRGVTREKYQVKTEALPVGLKSAQIFGLKRANAILQLEFEFSHAGQANAEKLKKLSSPQLKAITSSLNLKICDEYSVDTVIGSVSSNSSAIQTNTLNGWLHVESLGDEIEFISAVTRELAARVAIEKSLLNWATSVPKSFFRRFFRVPVASRVIRSWPVELLVDRSDLLDQFFGLRKSLNLPAVRATILESGRHWWTVFATVLALIGLLWPLLVALVNLLISFR